MKRILMLVLLFAGCGSSAPVEQKDGGPALKVMSCSSQGDGATTTCVCYLGTQVISCPDGR